MGGNLKSGERGLTKVEVKQAFEMSELWTVGVGTSVGTPRLHLRRQPDEKATEVLLLSKFFYARVDASNGQLVHLREQEGLFFPKDTAPAAAYDPYRDCLYYETPCFCLESPEDDWRCAVRYSDDDCTPDSDDECGDEDRRI